MTEVFDRRVFAGAVGLVAGLGLLAAATPITIRRQVRLMLPGLSGRYPVGTVDLHLVDARTDPWQASARRELMVTVTYPAQGGGELADWMSPRVASVFDQSVPDPAFLDMPAGVVDWSGTERPAVASAAVDGTQRWPVVLFSHGLGMLRELGSVLTDDLASHGYIVVSLSHPHDSTAIEFPGGQVVTGSAESSVEFLRRTMGARIADTRFVLDELTRMDQGDNPDAEKRPLPTGLVGALDLSAVGMFGHSLGGCTTAESMYYDRRIAAGINFDGAMSPGDVGESVQHGLDRPFLLVGSDFVYPATGDTLQHSHMSTDIDPSWREFWTNQRAWKRDLHFDGAAHNGFTDLQVVVPQLAQVLKRGAQQREIGRIDPGQSVSTQRAYVTAFFDLHLKHSDSHLFDGDNPAYPNTRFIP
ncbi:alpha/beta hydrolase family protein [Nocardia sp. NBC_01327]|uniref:alpha/beta hydrolase family protein n=1 Tax=Nocardia sp. NBC_01327 TaxID=2903593 RepID=UPI002E1183AB|nr:hypothetical protein OG326_15705 [Nocardia sp. NBC_01327]